MSDTREAGANPYVGPRAFRAGEALYGRDREVLDLLDLLIAERIVRFYSPSGAGKTSLVEAALIPRLADEGFRVLPTIRVHDEPASELKQRGIPFNRYVLSALRSLDKRLPEQQQTPSDELARLSLTEYLERRRKADGRPVSQVLIFDQFEEILTADPVDHEAKDEFFVQVGAALSDRRRWALFSLREDYLARLDPYLSRVPTRLNTSFRLDLLGVDAACLAIQKPAEAARRAFSDAAAGKLIDDLRKVRIQRPDGAVDEPLGRHVEPVQLQVVCRRLWDKLPPDVREIEKVHVDSVEDADEALAGYYAEQVAAVAARTEVSERDIRDWFGRELITEQDIRGQALQGRERAWGLDARVTQALVDAHLVRQEERRGAAWFELAHDRLIKPIRRNNAEFRANLSPLQRQAELWGDQGRPDGLLLRDQKLVDAERWAEEHQKELKPVESDLLRDSQKARADAERERRKNRVIAGLAAAFFFTTVIAIAALSTASTERIRAEQQAEIALSRQLAAQAVSLVDERPDLALLLSLEAHQTDANLEARGSLLTGLLQAPRLTMFLRDHEEDVGALIFSPDGKLLASGSADGRIILWNAGGDRPIGPPLTGDTGSVSSVAFRKNNGTLTLASGGADGTIMLWDVESHRPVGQPLSGHTSSVNSVGFSPDGQMLVSGSSDRSIRLWNVANGQLIDQPLTDHTAEVKGVAFSPDGRTLASASMDGRIILWDLTASPLRPDRLLTGHLGGVWSVAFSPDSKTLASSGSDKTVRLWDVGNGRQLGRPLTGHTNTVTSVAFSPDGNTLASGGADNTVGLWNVAARQPLDQQPLTGHTGPVLSVAFSPDGMTLASGGLDHTIILWNLAATSGLGRPLFVHAAAVHSLALSSDGQMVASSAENNTISLWSTATRQRLDLPLTSQAGSVTKLALSPDGKTMASSTWEGDVILWDTMTGQPIGQPLKGHSGPVRSVAFSRDGKLASSGCGKRSDGNCTQGEVRLWDVATGQPIGEPLVGHTGPVSSVAFSSNGMTLASASDDHAVILWDLTASPPRPGPPLTGHDKGITSVAFTLDGALLASSSTDGTVRLWNVATRQPVGQPLVGHRDEVRTLAFSPDGAMLASASKDLTIRLWDVATGQPNGDPITNQGHAVWDLAFSLDGQTLVSGGTNGVTFWNVATRQLVGQPLMGQVYAVWNVAFSPDGTLLASASQDGKIVLWGAATAQAIKSLEGDGGAVRRVVFSSDGKLLASQGDEGIIRLWDVARGSRIGEPLRAPDGWLSSVALSPDGKLLASGSTSDGGDHTVILWDLAASPPRPGPPLKGHAEAVLSVAFSPDSRTLASGSNDHTIVLWDVATGQPLGQPLTGHGDELRSVAFNRDGTKLASSDREGAIILWDLTASPPRPGRPLAGHAGAVLSVAFSPDGATLASAGIDTTIRLWDVATHRPLGQPLRGHTDEARSVAFSPDGRTLASSSLDGTIVFWDLSFESWQARACTIVAGNLKPEEWRQYLAGQEQRVTCPVGLLHQADKSALAGERSLALAAFEQVVRFALATNDAQLNAHICWYGSLDGFADVVLPACEHAVDLAPDENKAFYESDNKAFYRDNRGLALALTRDHDHAIEDFEFFAEWAEGKPKFGEYGLKRREWIDKLKQGDDPFDEATLKSLRRE